jgi:hypothetical protein
MGPCLTFHLAGGAGGMAHMLDHFGAALLEPWTRLAAPPLTQQLRDRMIDGCEREAAGRSVGELERYRDNFLAELLTLLERYSLSPVSPPAKAGIFEVADGSEPSDRPDDSERPGDNDQPLPAYWPG